MQCSAEYAVTLSGIGGAPRVQRKIPSLCLLLLSFLLLHVWDDGPT
jgi:hypothetical protein